MSISNVLAKTAGIIGLGLVAYDSHKVGQHHSITTANNIKANNITNRYLDNVKLDSSSFVENGMQKGIFKYSLDENISTFFTGIGGYFKGFTSMLVSNVIPFGLALGAFLGGGLKGQGIGGKISKFSGIGLLAYGAMALAQGIFGIGKEKTIP